MTYYRIVNDMLAKIVQFTYVAIRDIPCNSDLKKELWSNILLTGGNTCYKGKLHQKSFKYQFNLHHCVGFGTLFESEMKKLHEDVDIHYIEDAAHLTILDGGLEYAEKCPLLEFHEATSTEPIEISIGRRKDITS